MGQSTSERSERVEREASCSAGAYHECGRRRSGSLLISKPAAGESAAFASASAMAKHRRGGRIRYLQMNVSQTVGALAAGDVVKTDQANTIDDRVYALWAKGVWSLQGNTAGEGPMMVGFSHSDYTAAEVEEALEAGGSWDSGNKVANEQSNRKVRRVGEFDGLATEEKLIEGRSLFRKLGFYIEDGKTLACWTRNQDADARTAGGSINFNGIIAVRAT